tara:strand:+ start:151303 stop:151695 length:393 start_codon:yes stop_codon:yes gene_type:complete
MKTIILLGLLTGLTYAQAINVHCNGESIRRGDSFNLIGNLEDLSQDQLRGGFTIDINGEAVKEEIVEAQGELKGIRFRNLINSDTIKIAFKNKNSNLKTITIRPNSRQRSTIKYRNGQTASSYCEVISEN